MAVIIRSDAGSAHDEYPRATFNGFAVLALALALLAFAAYAI